MFLDLNGDEAFIDVIPKPQGNGDMRYEIWKEQRHLFTIHPQNDVGEFTIWILDEKYYGVTDKTISEIGAAIENKFM